MSSSDFSEVNSTRASADAAMSDSRWEDAETEWARLRDLCPTDLAGFVKGSEALCRLGRLQEGEALALVAVNRFPENLWVAHAYAGMAGKRDDWVEAVRRWAVVHEKFPNDPGACANFAAALITLGRLDEAELLLAWLMDHHPEMPDGWIGVGLVAARRSRWNDALSQWSSIRGRFPKLPLGHGYGVEALIMLERYNEAERLCAEGRVRFPNDLWIAHLFANLPAKQNDLDQSIERWEQIQRTFPLNPSSFENRAHLLRARGRLREARDAFAQAVLRFPDRPDNFIALAEAAMQCRAWAEAALLWAEIRRRFPERVEGFTRGIAALRFSGVGSQADALIQDGARRFVASADFSIVWLETALDCGWDLAQVWACWTRCRNLLKPITTSFATLSWRVMLLVHEEEQASDVLDVLFQEPLIESSIPALVQGLGRMLQSADIRFEQMHQTVAKYLMSREADREGLGIFVSALLGLTSWPDMMALVRSQINKSDRMTRILVSSFEGHQFAACGASSHAGSALGHCLDEIAIEFEQSLSPPTEIQLFNSLYYAFARDPSVFRKISGVFGNAFDCDTLQHASPVRQAAEAICSNSLLVCRPNDATRTISRQVPHVTRRKLRVALCVSGQLRGFKKARSSWDCFGLSHHDLITIVHVWRNVGRQVMAMASEQRGFPRSFVEPYNRLVSQVGLHTLRSRFPSFYEAFNERIDVDEDELRDFYQTEHIFIENDDIEPYFTFSNSQKMYKKVQSAYESALTIGKEFDLFVRIRPDKLVAGANDVDWAEVLQRSIDERTIFCDYGAVLSPTGELLVGDQFSAGGSAVMDVYARTYDWTKIHAPGLFGAETEFAGHVNFASSLLFHGVTAQKLPGVSFGGLSDPAGMSLKRLRALVETDLKRGPDDCVAKSFLLACTS